MQTYNVRIVFDLYFFRKQYLRQPSIDFDFCNLSSSGDVVYKECWWHWHKLVTDLFYHFVSILRRLVDFVLKCISITDFNFKNKLDFFYYNRNNSWKPEFV